MTRPRTAAGENGDATGNSMLTVASSWRYVLNVVVWEMNQYHCPALVHDRLRLRFDVTEPSGAETNGA